MKPPSFASRKKPKSNAPSGVTGIQPVPKKPVGKAHPLDPREFPAARMRTAATRKEIRETDHRVMGSRQSQKPVERHNQQRSSKRKSGK